MHIRTFLGSDDDLSVAIAEAEAAAQRLLDNLNPHELISVSAQSFIDRWEDGGLNHHTSFHVITVVFR